MALSMTPAAAVPYSGWPGHHDLARAAAALAARLPDELAPLARLAYTYRWSWMPGGHDLFRAVDEHRFELCGANPVRLLQEAPTASLVRAAADQALLERVEALDAGILDELARPARVAPVSEGRPAVFLCAEFGVHGSLPVYAGGLGVLAGDFLKQASDLRVPLVGVGLMYRQGYFRQRLDTTGWQHEYWVDTDPERLPGDPSGLAADLRSVDRGSGPGGVGRHR